ncbi:MAG TPA: hypothetical protein VLM37_01305 [Fibrobacteraceae bacterium]|nr:hypothetical protein [Fibrobacteraceae bacterium]
MKTELSLGVAFLLTLLLVACASQRKAANCSEIQYRLDHMQYTEDQREWIEGEWHQCQTEYDSLARIDSVRYGGIYQQFFDSAAIHNALHGDSSTLVDTTDSQSVENSVDSVPETSLQDSGVSP